MKIYESDDCLNIFLNNIYFKEVDWDDKKNIEDRLNNLFIKMKKFYKINLKGFYKVKVYPNTIGTFIELIKLDDENYDYSEIDFRVVVIFNKEFYFKFENYDLFGNKNIIFYNNSYYINIEEIDNYLKYADMGDIVVDDLIDFNKCIYINKKD